MTDKVEAIIPCELDLECSDCNNCNFKDVFCYLRGRSYSNQEKAIQKELDFYSEKILETKADLKKYNVNQYETEEEYTKKVSKKLRKNVEIYKKWLKLMKKHKKKEGSSTNE